MRITSRAIAVLAVAATALFATSTNASAAPGKASKPMTMASAWTVSITVNTHFLWPGQQVTVTATANQDVGPTPYYINIYDDGTDQYIKTCSSGTTCTATTTRSAPAYTDFLAYVSLLPSGNAVPPPGEQAHAYTLSGIYWEQPPVTLSASPTTLPVLATTTLTATTSLDVGPSPYFISIYDATAGTRLKVCGSGTSCSVTAAFATATTHKYVAYVATNSTALPPPNVQSTSAPSFVTWGAGWSVTLTAPTMTSGPATVTATASKDVGPTPYYIEIFDITTGTRIAVCGFGTTCSVSYSLPNYPTWFAAFVSANSTTLPPSSTQASSNTVSTTLKPPA